MGEAHGEGVGGGMSGYIDCGCRDCFEIAIGEPGDFCSGCEKAGCEPDSECCQESAYGGSGDDEAVTETAVTEMVCACPDCKSAIDIQGLFCSLCKEHDCKSDKGWC